MNITELKKQLSEKTISINFTKIDGSERIMRCTRNFNKIPISQLPKKIASESKQAINESVLRVFDIDKQEWRSIKNENINSWTVE